MLSPGELTINRFRIPILLAGVLLLLIWSTSPGLLERILGDDRNYISCKIHKITKAAAALDAKDLASSFSSSSSPGFQFPTLLPSSHLEQFLYGESKGASTGSQYTLFFGYHEGKNLSFATINQISDTHQHFQIQGSLEIAWRDGIVFDQYEHISSPEIVLDEHSNEIWLLFHYCCSKGGMIVPKSIAVEPHDSQTPFKLSAFDQYTLAAKWDVHKQQFIIHEMSPYEGDDMKIRRDRAIVAPSYLRVFRYRGGIYGIAKEGNKGGILMRAASYGGPWRAIKRILRHSRHVAVFVEGDTLFVAYSNMYDKPESIKLISINLAGLSDPYDWDFDEPVRNNKIKTILEADQVWEGAALNLTTAGNPGPAHGSLKGVRDPNFVRESGSQKVYVTYVGGGEEGIGIAELPCGLQGFA